MPNQLADTGILGLIQGLTEWLPVSSTGHLKIAEHYLGLTTTPLFNITLHLGTLIVVLIYFNKEVRDILKALVRLDFRTEYGRMIPLIITATIPTAIIGLLYVQYLEDSLQQMAIIGRTFIAGGTLVYLSRFGRENAENISYPAALVLGVAQGLAVFPGLSRSGATISVGLLAGLKRERAFRFSFLLSIPAILGNLVVEAFKQQGQFAVSGIGYPELVVGVAVAMIVGYFAIKLLSKIVQSRKFHYFAAYTWLLGITLIIVTLNT